MLCAQPPRWHREIENRYEHTAKRRPYYVVYIRIQHILIYVLANKHKKKQKPVQFKYMRTFRSKLVDNELTNNDLLSHYLKHLVSELSDSAQNT